MSDPNATTESPEVSQQSGTGAAPPMAIPEQAAGAAPDVNADLSGVQTQTAAGDVGAQPTQAPTHDATLSHDESQTVLADLLAIEQHALFMGGERGVDIRNRICRVRMALTGRSDHPAE